MSTEWSGEVLIPSANITGYRLVYEAETWLRRICLAAFLLAKGPEWARGLHSTLRARLEFQSRSNSARWYLGVDAEEELLWSTTYGQLAELLRLATIAPQVVHLCGLPASLLSDRLASVAEVRNALAHSRAISEDTLTVLKGDLAVILAAVDRFKRKTLYAESEIFMDEFPDDLAELGSAFMSESGAFPEQQLFVSANNDFVFLVRLPVPPFERWPKVASLRESFGMTSHLLLCVLANKQGDELQLAIPRSLANSEKLQVLRAFMTADVLQGGWTDRPPDAQHPADVCWPRLWFYENRRPDR